MSSKVIVNIASDPFKQIATKHQEIINDRPEILGLTSTDPVVRANQLEQNIRFLQEQHQIMLSDLHNEIEVLRQRNRDLQFQIVFSKGVNLMQGSPSSDEEFQRKFSFSPGQVNITPLQVEILERNVAELKTNLSEAKTKNLYLQNVIDEQKKKISMLENEKLDLAAVGKKIGKENVTVKSKVQGGENSIDILQEKLEDADRLVRRLRRENEEQRKEIVSLRTSMNKGKMDLRRSDSNSVYKNFHRNGQTQSSRFPPVHSHPHWRNSLDNHSSQTSDRDSGRLKKESEIVGRPIPSLPYLRDKNNASTSSGYNNQNYNYQTVNHKRGYYYHKKPEEHRGSGKTLRRENSRHQENER